MVYFIVTLVKQRVILIEVDNEIYTILIRDNNRITLIAFFFYIDSL